MTAAIGTRLLGGPDLASGPESLRSHLKRLGPRHIGGSWLLEALRQSGLCGRGGAWFPTWRKWSAVGARSDGDAVVVINASEGEPLSSKDGLLLRSRPHLVFDGAVYAAETLGADDIVLHLSRESPEVDHAVEVALAERRVAGDSLPAIRVERTANRYVAGESSAVVNRLSGGQSKPRWSLGRSAADKGVDDRPTLVQNAETLAHAAMIARYGPAWFRKLGTQATPGTTLMTVCGNVSRPGVYEVDLRASLGEVVHGVGGPVTAPGGALLGGYFGSWLSPERLQSLPLDGAPLGCGVLAVLPQDGCPIVEATRILKYLAAESAGQCGPCINGLTALAGAMGRIAASAPVAGDMDHVRRWIAMVRGRGACKHPDGAVGQLESALTGFDGHLQMHLYRQPCRGWSSTGFPAPPRPGDRWR